jgi:PIN domain-containing protein
LNQQIKLFFDACLSKKLPRLILSVFGEDYENLQVKHLTDYFQQNDDDGDWLPLLEQDKDWIVITADRGKDPKKEQLPVLCSQLGISHIAMTPSFHQSGYLTHKHAVLSLFPQIICMGHLPKGTKVTMGFKPYHQRQWPTLLIGGFDFDSWCNKNGIILPNRDKLSN